jgi:hypothetical protein
MHKSSSSFLVCRVRIDLKDTRGTGTTCDEVFIPLGRLPAPVPPRGSDAPALGGTLRLFDQLQNPLSCLSDVLVGLI